MSLSASSRMTSPSGPRTTMACFSGPRIRMPSMRACPARDPGGGAALCEAEVLQGLLQGPGQRHRSCLFLERKRSKKNFNRPTGHTVGKARITRIKSFSFDSFLCSQRKEWPLTYAAGRVIVTTHPPPSALSISNVLHLYGALQAGGHCPPLRELRRALRPHSRGRGASNVPSWSRMISSHTARPMPLPRALEEPL